ncbi:TetR/AcrR family transcriptional regulator [Pedobacter sp. SD-b]|uniref:TetR/AcrR family transcriptional regulator n=1 Tax=Pedobacter segetis TaxID=2793069 RepID=A0ABS1BJP7_9SPHI|nr:TetR/AcrR family transcriptional regulator [Pedobacter segetis]MBK0383105.1 TetR/AcrR family transcriptional regulator [Pedobacter segetis]
MTEERQDKKDHILEIAEKLFADLGYDGASTRHISQAAGVNMAMLNYYFGGKEGLYLSIFQKHVTQQKIKLENLNNEEISSIEKLEKCIDDYADKMMSNCAFQKIIYREMSLSQRSELNKKIISLISLNALEVKRIISEGIKNGSFNQDADADMLVASLFGTKSYIINAAEMSSLLMGYDVTNPSVIETVVKPRLKNHIKKMFRAYLINNNENN